MLNSKFKILTIGQFLLRNHLLSLAKVFRSTNHANLLIKWELISYLGAAKPAMTKITARNGGFGRSLTGA